MKNNINLCIVAPKPSNVGGISRWCSIYTSFLEKNNQNFFLLDTTPTISFQARKNIFKRILTSIPLAIKISSRLKKLIKHEHIDCVHIATSSSLSLFRDKRLINICKKHSIRVIYHYHFGTFDKIIKKHNWESRLLINNSKKCFKTICIDKTTYKLASVFLPNVIQIYNPVIDNNFNSNINSKRIVFAGHVRDNKGVKELIEAWDQIYPKYKDWRLTICGELFFDYIEKSKDPNNLNKNLFFTGLVDFDCLQNIMLQSSIFVLPSYYEGCPNVILEAMSNSMAIVATRVGAIPELLDGCGKLIETKNVDDIVTALEFYINNPDERLKDGAAAKKRIQTDLSAVSICKKYLDIAKAD